MDELVNLLKEYLAAQATPAAAATPASPVPATPEVPAAAAVAGEVAKGLDLDALKGLIADAVKDQVAKAQPNPDAAGGEQTPQGAGRRGQVKNDLPGAGGDAGMDPVVANLVKKASDPSVWGVDQIKLEQDEKEVLYRLFYQHMTAGLSY